MRMRRWLMAGLLILGGGAALAESALPFEVATVEPQTVVRETVVNAVIEAVHSATISAQTSGRVVEINFDVDDYVTKDSVLIRFRDTEQRSALKAAQARYAEAEAEFKRTRDIYEKKLVAKAVFDRAEAAFKAARAGLEQAQEQVEHTVVRAPYSGIVVQRHIEVGELASPGKPLMTGLSLERLRAVADVPQAHIDTVRSLARARVLVPDGADGVEADKLTISPFADPVSHTFKVRVELPPGQHGVYPGMFAKVAFAVGEESRLLVPAAAVVYRSEVTGVYVVGEGERVALRQIRIGRRLPAGNIEVLAGLAAGERIALDPIRAGIHLKGKREGAGT